MSSSNVRVRFAPSPTGYLHVGGARSLLFNWLFARHHGGTLVLRIEDTDQARSTREFEQMQKQDIAWLGLNWDEGPALHDGAQVGAHGPYRQSERLQIYQDHAARLMAAGDSYYCFCSGELLETKKQTALKEGRPPHYDGTCRSLSMEENRARIKNGERAVVRFHIKNPKKYAFTDLIRGPVEFQEGMVGDFVLLRSDGMPVYNFCCVVDDHLMEMTHVLRAEEHLSNTVRQLMIYDAFGWTPPQFGHMSVVLGPDKQKLSKRHGATSVNEYRLQGYLPEAIKNYIALLGWSSPDGREILPLQEMVALFDTDRINASPAVFDGVKLKWMNSMYVRSMNHSALWKVLEPFLREAGLHFDSVSAEWIERALTALKPSFETLVEAVEAFRPLADNQFQILPEAVDVLSWPKTKALVVYWIERLKGLKSAGTIFLSEAQFAQLQAAVQKDVQVKGKELFQPLRVAVVGKPHGPELKLLVPLLNINSLIARAEKLQRAIGE